MDLDQTQETQRVVVGAAASDVQPTAAPRRGGCWWGLLGALGCLTALLVGALVVVVAVVYFGLQIPQSLLGYFNPSNYPITIRADIFLERIKTLSQLTTVRYNFSSVVSSEREMPDLLATLYGDRQVMIAVGHITAGVDLTSLTTDDVVLDGGILTVRMPPAALQDCFLNEQMSYIASRETGIFAQPAPELDNSARRYAIEQFRQQALNEGILDQAQTQAATIIREVLLLSAAGGIAEVQVLTTPPDLNAPLPETCG